MLQMQAQLPDGQNRWSQLDEANEKGQTMPWLSAHEQLYGQGTDSGGSGGLKRQTVGASYTRYLTGNWALQLQS